MSSSSRRVRGSVGEDGAPPNRLPNPPGCVLVLRHRDPADDTAGRNDPEGLLVGGGVAHGLEDDAGVLLSGEVADLGDALLATLGDDVGGAGLAPQVRTWLVATIR